MSVAIITGASSGIGREFARQMKEKCSVDEFWFVARRTENMIALRDELGVKAKIISADLATSEGIDAVRAALAQEKVSVSYLVNAAGFGNLGSFDELSENEVAGMIDLNVKATVLITHRVIPFMERGGRIIELGSASCFTPLPNFNVYAASKAFVLHYTKALNYELRPYGVRATCFCPGWVDTAFLGIATEETRVHRPKKMKPLLRVEDVVRRAVKASVRGKSMCVTNWFTKLQHVLFKLLPDCLLTKMWLGMQVKDSDISDGKEADA
jgi:short-subunit dehydrogenase